MSETYQPHSMRFQLSRKKGYRKPEGGVVVARPSKWGNPFVVIPEKRPRFDAHITAYQCYGQFSEPGVAAELFRFWLLNIPQAARLREALHELRGKRLGCWCPLDRPCHADVLCELANK